MREDDILRLSLNCARLVVTGQPYESVLADGVAAIMRTDAGTGVTTWDGTHADPIAAVEVVVSGMPPIDQEGKNAALAVMNNHPTFARRQLPPTHRLSDTVCLPAFWDTDIWHVMHGHGNGRYPAAVMLALHHDKAMFVGVQRTRRDFDADDMATLDLLREPLTTALAFRAAWQDATKRCRSAINDPSFERLTQREEQVIGLVALGWTNTRIGRQLKISERTVRKHLENINDKLGTTNRAAAVHQSRSFYGGASQRAPKS